MRTRCLSALVVPALLVGCGAVAPTLMRLEDIEPGEDCTVGGVQVFVGNDDDGDGRLSDAEVDTDQFICDGTSGSDGVDGTNGTEGEDAPALLTRTTSERPGANCPNGGTRLDLGFDENGNGVLDVAEQRAPIFLCDAGDGTDAGDGATGEAGADGADAIVRIDAVAVGSTACPAGGYHVVTGHDLDDDGALTGDEIVTDLYVCNGEDGSDGV
jgi:hypothetical protein